MIWLIYVKSMDLAKLGLDFKNRWFGGVILFWKIK
jgi:hypothetical protein